MAVFRGIVALMTRLAESLGARGLAGCSILAVESEDRGNEDEGSRTDSAQPSEKIT